MQHAKRPIEAPQRRVRLSLETLRAILISRHATVAAHEHEVDEKLLSDLLAHNRLPDRIPGTG